MEEEMFVGDVVSQIAYDPGFDGMGCRAPFVGRGGKNVKAAWMRKVWSFFVLICPVVLSVVEVMLVSERRVSRAGSVTVEGRGASGVVSLAMA
jgi:hypothetical protein